MKTQRIRSLKKLLGMLVLIMLFTCIPTAEGMAATTTAEQQFRELYVHILENGDNSVHDISALNLPYMTCYNIMQDVKYNEGFLVYQCYSDYNLMRADQMSMIDDTPYLFKFHMSLNDTGFKARYAKAKQLIYDVRSELDDKMTDMDKLLYFHEYIVENIYYYNNDAANVHFGGCTLAQGYGVCDGYSHALMIFLKAENIPCVEIASDNHAWIAARIDGEWYLVDNTWDDTRAATYGTHYFFVRNDNEFYHTMNCTHTPGDVTTSSSHSSSEVLCTSTKYTNWYVHDVWNRMYYYDGYWYYVLNNAIRKNNIQGTDETVLCEGTNLTITGINGRYLSYSNNGQTSQLDLGEKTPVTPSTPENPSNENDNSDSSTTPSDDNDKPDSSLTPSDDNDKPDSSLAPSDDNDKPDSSLTPSDDNDMPDSFAEDIVVESDSSKVRTPALKSVVNKKGKKIKITLKEKVCGATGYEVKICTNKKFKKCVKTLTFTGTTKTVSKLNKNRTYYIKVRAYKTDSDGRKIYGSYSKITKVRIKK